MSTFALRATADFGGRGRTSGVVGVATEQRSCAEDVRAISEAVGFDRCVVCGLSGGGPHALACAVLLDGLVMAAAAIASWAPLDAPGFDYFAGMSEEARKDYELFLSDRRAWEREGNSNATSFLL